MRRDLRKRAGSPPASNPGGGLAARLFLLPALLPILVAAVLPPGCALLPERLPPAEFDVSALPGRYQRWFWLGAAWWGYEPGGNPPVALSFGVARAIMAPLSGYSAEAVLDWSGWIVVFNADLRWGACDPDPPADAYDLPSVAAHEIGHIYRGPWHSDDRRDLMYDHSPTCFIKEDP